MTNITVSPGHTSSGLTISSAENLYVYGSALDITVSVGGYEYVYAGGSAISTTVRLAGNEYVSSGGTAISTTVSNAGTERVLSDGTASDTTVSSGGEEVVSSGGTTSFTTVSNGGAEFVYSGGTAISTTASNVGSDVVFAGGVASFTTVSNGGYEKLFNHGSSISTTVDFDGEQDVSAGGVASDTTVNADGTQYLSTGGSAISTTVYSEGYQDVVGGSASFTTLSGGEQTVSSGGKAVSTTIGNGGYQNVSAGGTATGTMVDSGGKQGINSGTALFTTVSGGGTEIVSYGGTAISTTVSGGAYQAVSGGVASATTLAGGASQVAGYSGTAVSTRVNSGGAEFVTFGGTSSFTTISSGGAELVSSGGSAVSTTVDPGGYLIVLAGGMQTSTTGAIVSTGVLVVQPGSSVAYYPDSTTSVVLSSGAYEYILPGGTAISTTVSGGSTDDVYSGGVTSFTTVSSGGAEYVYSSGTAIGTLVESDGSQEVASGGTASDTILTYAAQQYVSGGTAISTALQDGGTETVFDGGSVSFTTVTSQGQDVVSAGGTALSTTVDSGGEESVYGIASFTTVSNGGIQEVLGTGLAANTLVDSGGTQFVYGNAQAVSTTVDSGGVEVVFSGGVTSFTTVSNGDIEILFSGGTAVSTTVSAGGELIVLPGGHQSGTSGLVVSGGVVLYQPGSAVTYYAQVASGITVSNDATEYVLSGGSAVSNTVNQEAEQFVYSGGTTTSTTVNQYGNETVLFSGIASDTTVNGDGYETVSGGGLTINTTVSGGGYEIVNYGLTINTTLSGGSENLVGGVSSDTTADGGGTEYSFSGATTVSTTVNDASYQIVSGGDLYSYYYSSFVYVYGGTTSDTTVNSGGTEEVEDLSTAISTTVNSGGALFVSLTSLDAPAGTASFTTVNSGGVEVIAGGSATSTTVNLSGSIDFQDLAYASGGSAFVNASDVLSVTVGVTTVTQQLAGTYFASENFVLAAGTYGGTQVTLEGTPCYCRGTRILTDGGELAVEDLHIGDRLVTLSGAVRPLRWIGRRSYAGRFAAGNRNVLPVLIRRDALADGVPRRDLCVSPLHAMYLDEVLIPAAALVNGASIVQVEAVDEVAYFHLELETHDIILAEGAASETFVDDDSRGMFHNAGEYRVMYPDAPRVPARFCAPRVEDGEALEVVRRRLAARADGAGGATTKTVPHPLVASAAERTKGAGRGHRAKRLGTSLTPTPGPNLGPLSNPIPQGEVGKDVAARSQAPAADPPSAQPSNLQGHIDHVGRGRIAGWARDAAAPEHPVRLRILANDVAIGEAVADLYRADLQRRDIGDGRYGFELTIEGGLSPLQRHVIRVQRMLDGRDLPNSPWMMEAAPLTLPAPAVDGTRGSPFHGQLDLATRERIAGWARNGLTTQGLITQRLATQGPAILGQATPGTDPRTPVALQILDNGLPIARVLANRAREDLAVAGIGDGRYGFDIIIPGGLSPLARHVIQVRREADGAELPGSPAVIEAARGFDAGLRQAIASAVAAAGPGDNEEHMLSFMLAQADRLLQQRADVEGHRVERLAWRQYQRRWGSLTDNSRSDLSPDVPLRQPPAHQPPGHESRAGVPGGRSGDGSGSSPPRMPGGSPGAAPGDAARDVPIGAPVDTAAVADLVRRALVIDERIPVAGRDAGSQAILSHMRALQRLGYEVSFVAADEMAHAEFAPDGAAPSQASAALGAAGVTCCAAPFYTSAEDLLRRQAECFDVVYLHRASIATRYLALARRYMPRARILYGVADLHHVRLERQAAIEARPELLAASRRTRLEECVAAWSADAVITHSADEAELLRRMVPEASVYRVPWEVRGKAPPGAGAVAPTVSNGAMGVVAEDAAADRRVDQLAPAAAAAGFVARRGVAFIGGYAHAPNVDAACWLVDGVMPLVRQADPTIECLLVGSDMPEVVWRLAGPGVVALGHVEDLGRVFQRVRLTVAPLRYGAGVKGKVLESLAAGVPCVMTPVAAEGLGLPASLRALVGEDAVQLAALILCLHGDAKVHRTAVEAGQALIHVNHNAAGVTAALLAAIEGRAHEPRGDGYGHELPQDGASEAWIACTTGRSRAGSFQRHGRARPGSVKL